MNKAMTPYFDFRVALESAYGASGGNLPFEEVWRAESASELHKYTLLTAKVWGSAKGLFAPGYFYEVRAAIIPETAEVVFPNLFHAELDEAIAIAKQLVEDAKTIKSGFGHLLRGKSIY